MRGRTKDLFVAGERIVIAQMTLGEMRAASKNESEAAAKGGDAPLVALAAVVGRAMVPPRTADQILDPLSGFTMGELIEINRELSALASEDVVQGSLGKPPSP
jgi:hypothetical protein